MDEIKGTIIRRTIRSKERFYHQWREDGKTKSRYLRAEEVLPLREKLDATRPQSKPAENGTPLFSAGVIEGLRLKELTADARRLTPREILGEILGAGPIVILAGEAGTGKTTLIKHVLLTYSDAHLGESAYLSLPENLSAPEFLHDLTVLFDRGFRRFFIDGIDRSGVLTGTVSVLGDLFVSRGARFLMTARTAFPSAIPVISTTRVSFRDFCLIAQSENLADYLKFRGLDAEIAAHEPTSRHLGAAARKLARDRIRAELTETKLKEIIVEETRLRRTSPTTEVVVPELATGGVDLIVVDHDELTCELYEIRSAAERDDRQIARLENSRNLDVLEHHYGTITTREVLYLGRNAWHHNGIFYRNAAAYLRGKSLT